MKAYRESSASGWEGVPIRYTAWGEGEPTLVCCNGLGVSTFFWKYLVRYFADDHCVITWDYRGHKKSGYPAKRIPQKFTIAANARDLLGVLDDAEVEKAVLIGHSMGVQVILEFWRRYPERVSALVPVCGPYGRPMDTLFQAPAIVNPVFGAVYSVATSFPRLLERAVRPVFRTRVPQQIARLTNIVNPIMMDLEDLQPYLDHFAEMDLQVFYFMAGEMQKHNAGPWLHTIDVPTLIVGGENDMFSPLALSIEMRDKIPDAELLILPKGSHAGLVEHPDLLNLRLEKFLRERL